MRSPRIGRTLPSPYSAAAALLAALLLVLAFPDYDFWYLAYAAPLPLIWSIELESGSRIRSLLVGWLFGTSFFFGTCWWLTYAPIHYGGIPAPFAYTLIFIACAGGGSFFGVFALVLSRLRLRLGPVAFLAAPFIWTAAEFARYWITGNNWNTIGYSQAFSRSHIVDFARYGGVLLVTFYLLIPTSALAFALFAIKNRDGHSRYLLPGVLIPVLLATGFLTLATRSPEPRSGETVASVIAVQPNVPMSGLDSSKWEQLRQRQIDLAQSEIGKLLPDNGGADTAVILPESPMNFMYENDREFQQFTRTFTTTTRASLVFNSAEPDGTTGKFFNSAVMVGQDGRKAAQYDKVFLLPFGEAVPAPLDNIMPAFVGTFSYGRNYNMLPLGRAQAGVMICFESHFGGLGRRYVQQGADVLLEMTNDGYLGPTPVLRQHLANAVFRAIETDRPVLRVTNVGITAYITENGAVLDPAPSYVEATRVWTVSKSHGLQTFYVRFGDWFAWLCIGITLFLLGYSVRKKVAVTPA